MTYTHDLISVGLIFTSPALFSTVTQLKVVSFPEHCSSLGGTVYIPLLIAPGVCLV